MALRGSAFEILVIRRQSGFVRNPIKDRLLEAMYPGKRISKHGHPYWETRKNRSDMNKQARW